MDGEILSGGTTTVVRIGRTVRRPVRAWSEAVQWLLAGLAAAQVRGVPRWGLAHAVYRYSGCPMWTISGGRAGAARQALPRRRELWDRVVIG